jgi:hypothetical protein
MKSLAIMAAAAGVALGYVASHVLGLPMVWLDSALGAWSFGVKPSSAAMDFFGRALWGLSFGALSALAFARVVPTERRARAVAVVCGLVIAAALGVEVSRLWSRVPVAEEFPEGYDPITGRVVLPAPTRFAQP